MKIRLPKKISILDNNWLDKYYQLVEFKKKHRHTRVPANYKMNPTLANWVHIQRRRRHNLALWREDLLRKIEFEFIIRKPQRSSVLIARTDPSVKKKVLRAIQSRIIITTENPKIFSVLDFQWYFRLLELIKFHKQHGHIQVPNNKHYISLVWWIRKQRATKHRLGEAKIAILNSLNFTWRVFAPIVRTPWEKRYQELIRYKKKYGHPHVPQTYPSLGRWLWMQRRADKSKALKPEREKLLLKLGVILDFKGNNRLGYTLGSSNELWEEKYNRLVAFKKRFGHCAVHQKWEKDRQLGRWVFRQRRLNKAGKLLPERKKKLDRLGFKWSPKKIKA